jgi:Fic family protein
LSQLPDAAWRRVSARNTWGSNTVEGNSLNRAEVERLLLAGETARRRPLGDILETAQHDRAFRGLLGRLDQPVGVTAVLELHEVVFRGVKADAGQWRRVNVRITGSRHVPPRMEKVAALMGDWVREYAARETAAQSVFAVATWMHESFEAIHPFSDGNGRVGRLLLNLHMLRHSWPPVAVTPAERNAYIGALELGHIGDLVPLERLLDRLMGASLVELLDMVGSKEDELKPLVAFERGGPYSAKYLALRAGQGELPALKQRGDWTTSARALSLYRKYGGRA